MKFSFKRVWQILLIIALPIIIYNTKTGYYQNKIDFYKTDINAVITKINQTRGTKVFYNEFDYFYLEQLEKKSLKVGDSISKKGSQITVFDKKNRELSSKTKVIRPEETYFKFFFGL